MTRERRDLQKQAIRILEDRFLRKIARESVDQAEHLYRLFKGDSPTPPVTLEIGSAGGIIATLRPNWTTSDVLVAPGVQVILPSDGSLPFDSRSFDMIFMQDTLHHIADLPKFFDEASRLLSPDGILVAREPYWSVAARAIFKFVHPETYSLRELRSRNEWADPMEGNQALLEGIYRNVRGEFDWLHRAWHFDVSPPSIGLAFALSGGATFTTQIPRSPLIKIHEWENSHSLWMRVFGLGALAVFRKKQGPTRSATGG